MENPEIIIVIGTIFTCIILLIAGILVMFTQKKRIHARQELHDAMIHHEREKHRNEILVQERTLRDLGKTLHDDFGPVLTSLGVYLEVIKTSLPENGNTQVNHSINSMKDSISETKKKMRNVSRMLYPVNLEKFGLADAIESLASQVTDQYNIDVNFNCLIPTDNNFGKVQNIIIYRLVQELLHNAVKYSQASTVDITLAVNNFEIQLMFRDNGIGMPAKTKSEGLGLAMSKSRVESLDGTFQLIDTKGKGTGFEINIPINSTND